MQPPAELVPRARQQIDHKHARVYRPTNGMWGATGMMTGTMTGTRTVTLEDERYGRVGTEDILYFEYKFILDLERTQKA